MQLRPKLYTYPVSRIQLPATEAAWVDPEGGQGVRIPLKNYRNIGFPSNINPDSGPENSQGQHLMLGNHGPASETPFKWRFTGGPMMAHL